jgi:hypothetical protein
MRITGFRSDFSFLDFLKRGMVPDSGKRTRFDWWLARIYASRLFNGLRSSFFVHSEL